MKKLVTKRKTIPIGITIPRDLLPRLQRAAFESGRSLSAFLCYCARRELGEIQK